MWERTVIFTLMQSMKDPKWVCGFAKPDTNPAAFMEPATTVLSPYLTHGCLSARLFHLKLVTIYRAANGKHSQPPVSLRWVRGGAFSPLSASGRIPVPAPGFLDMAFLKLHSR